jgi:division/cell wall cluster transcriptional repressor MraZ
VFAGKHYCGIDTKGRVSLMQPYRERFGEYATVLRWKDHLRVFTPDNFEKIGGFVESRLSFDSDQGLKSFFDPKLQNDRRHFFGNKYDLGLDSQGRIGIPKQLRESMGLVEDVVWVGCGAYLELWSKPLYDVNCVQWEQAGGFDKLFSERPAPTSASPGGDGDGPEAA